MYRKKRARAEKKGVGLGDQDLEGGTAGLYGL